MKKIKINPAFFNLTKKKKEKKKKEKPTTFKANKIKKAFLEKIKKHQEKKKYGEKFKDTLKFENEFEKALGYLDKVQTEKKQKRQEKQPEQEKTIKDDPPWGILKNGKKPLYRQYHNTLKKKEVEKKNIPERKVRLEDLKCRIRHTGTPKTLRKYIKRRLGKQRNRKINIMINNKTVRRETEKKCRTLKNKKLSTMKTELRRKGLLRVGSTAPQNIIREIYVASNLAGEVTNKGGGVILHNYLKKDDIKKQLKVI